MRKQFLPESGRPVVSDLLDVQRIATVALTSENPDYPIENALGLDDTVGWRAAGPGPQTIRIVFDSPQRLRQIHLHFIETQIARTQEFVLAWAGDPEAQSLLEIARQQWNFSPSGATEEIEHWDVELPSVMTLQLRITPDIATQSLASGCPVASLKALRLTSA